MKFEKKGLICNSASLGLHWAGRNIMTPLPIVLPNHDIRVFLTVCDDDNVGRVGFVDLNPDSPNEIKRISECPCLDVGASGMFDEHGVLPTSLLLIDDAMYLYYSAYQRQVSVPYTILSGLAVSKDYGETFSRVSECPILERCDGQLFQRSAIEVMERDGRYLMWYTAGSGWQNNSGHVVPRYNIQYMESADYKSWTGKPVVSLELHGDEYGLTMPQVEYKNGKYRMVYSIRSVSKGYRMGYAESEDGIAFRRMDDQIQLEPSPSGWDSEMICFGKMLSVHDRTYMFYCGNHYGLGGMGWAELVE